MLFQCLATWQTYNLYQRERENMLRFSMLYVSWACENVLGEHGYIFTAATRCCGSVLETGGWAGALFQPLLSTLRVIAALHCLAQTDWNAAKRRESKMSGLVEKKSHCTPTVFSILSALKMDMSLPPTCRSTNSPYISEVWTWKFKCVNSKKVKLLRL